MSQQIKLNQFELIIFDMDGVILNIFDAIKQAITDTVAKYELKVNIDDVMGEMATLIERLQCIPIPKILLNAKELLDVSFLENETVIKILRIASYMYSQFKEYKENSSIYAGSDKIIKYLANSGKKLAILSNNKKSSVVESLNKYDLTRYFTEIVGANDTDKLKPEPDGLFKIMKDQGIKDPNKVLFIGDMRTDAQAGKAAKVPTLCVASGLNKKEDLLLDSPEYLFDTLLDMGKAFGVAF